MAKRKKVEQKGDGVEVTILYEGCVLPPPLAPRQRKRHCPSCGYGPATRKDRYGTSRAAYLYRCQRCVDPETCLPTTWKEPRC